MGCCQSWASWSGQMGGFFFLQVKQGNQEKQRRNGRSQLKDTEKAERNLKTERRGKK